MKKIISNIFATLPMMLLLAGCSQTESISDVSSDVSSQCITATIQMPTTDLTRAAFSESYGSLDLQTNWENGDELQLIITQDDKTFEVGNIPITDINPNGKSATITFNIPQGVSLGKGYTLYAFSGIKGIVTYVDKWYPSCHMKLVRTELEKFKAPLFCQATVYEACPVLQFRHFETYELLHIKNASNSYIWFRHDGFRIDNPWYRGNSEMLLTNSWDPTNNLPNGWKGEAQSEVVEIPAKGEATIISAYLPSGYKMKDAYLQVSINGTSVTSTNKKSSDLTVEQGHAYHLYATWDGNKLSFDNGDAPLVKTISVAPSRLEFKTLAVDEGDSKPFTVSNTGTDVLTYKIAATDGDFSIEGSGKTVTLQPGATDTYTVIFKPTIEDHQYNQTVEITSDATNGTQYLTLVGSSEKKRIDHVVPPEIKEQMDPYITIYEGANPPNIEGIYLMSPDKLKYDATKQFDIGHVFNDMYIQFYNQDMINNTIDYREKNGNSEGSGSGCFISGEGDKFSVYFNVDEVSHYSKYDIYLKKAVIISGILTNNGIKDLEYAFVIVEKSDDPSHYLINPGDFRVVMDGDGMASFTSWSRSVRTRGSELHLPSIGERAR